MSQQTIKTKMFERIRHFQTGRVLMAKDFLDIASRGTVDVALSALVREGKIRRIQRGLYDRPKTNPALGGVLSVDIDQAARALARRFQWTLIPAGAWAANLLGLSTQVPAKIIYLSDGPSKRVPLDRRMLHFKHARPHVFRERGGKPAIVIEALRHLGKEHVDRKAVLRLKNALSDSEKRRLIKATRFGVEWIYDTAKKIAGKSA
jgi:uncharacterized protein DUF6088